MGYNDSGLDDQVNGIASAAARISFHTADPGSPGDCWVCVISCSRARHTPSSYMPEKVSTTLARLGRSRPRNSVRPYRSVPRSVDRLDLVGPGLVSPCFVMRVTKQGGHLPSKPILPPL